MILALEPINKLQCDFINTIEEGLDMVRKVDSDNFKLMVDIFHMNIEEPSVEKSIEEAKEYLIHVHICDSNRYPPGYGHINFKSVIKALEKNNYRGFLSAEVLPIISNNNSAKITYSFLKDLTEKENYESQA